MHIFNFAPNQILTDKKVVDEMNRLRTEKTLTIQRDIYPKEDSWFLIYYGNIQSLTRHIEYLRKDIISLSLNLILLNETYLTFKDPDHAIVLEGFNMYRFDSERTPNGHRPYNGLILYCRPYFGVHVI